MEEGGGGHVINPLAAVHTITLLHQGQWWASHTVGTISGSQTRDFWSLYVVNEALLPQRKEEVIAFVIISWNLLCGIASSSGPPPAGGVGCVGDHVDYTRLWHFVLDQIQNLHKACQSQDKKLEGVSNWRGPQTDKQSSCKLLLRWRDFALLSMILILLCFPGILEAFLFLSRFFNNCSWLGKSRISFRAGRTYLEKRKKSIKIYSRECGAKDWLCRQSAKLFSSRRNWDNPKPSPTGECAPHPPLWLGGRGTLAGERGSGRVPIPTRGHTLWYSICKYFLLDTTVNCFRHLISQRFPEENLGSFFMEDWSKRGEYSSGANLKDPRPMMRWPS